MQSQVLLKNEDWMLLDQNDPFMKIGQLAQRPIAFQVTVDFSDGEQAWMAKAVTPGKKVPKPLRLRPVRLVEDILLHIELDLRISLFVDQRGVRKACGTFRMRLHVSYLLFQLFGKPDVVGMDDRNIFSDGFCAQKSAAAVGVLRLKKRADSRVGVPADDIVRSVGRTIVRNQEFKIGKRLTQNAFNRLSDEILVVVR